jgi:hypothetical protein
MVEVNSDNYVYTYHEQASEGLLFCEIYKLSFVNRSY